MAGMVHHLDAPEHKAVRNWEDFLKEVGTIFIGVMIALAADQAVDAWTWHKEVAIAQDTLDDELADSLFAAEERIKITECQRKTLDALDDLADKSRGTLVIRNTPVSRNRVWGSAAWEAAVASGTIAHMPHDTRNSYAQLFSYVRVFRDMNLRQQELWATINAYRRERPFTETSRDRFVETVSQLRSLTHTMNLGAQQFVEAAKPLNIPLGPRSSELLRQPLDCPMP
ncbi:MAG TPA: hypothetical protein VHE36_09440 [Sphingomicrobium sp.]|nr:hypothetical protein [Sphingomicrobium sp.]